MEKQSPSVQATADDADPGSTPAVADGPAEGTPPEAPSSPSPGGLACSRESDLGGGRMSCVTKVAGVELRIVRPRDGSGPMRLGLYLHGDGAAAHLDDSAVRAMLTWVDAKRGLGVSALAPNGCSWWQTPTHDCASNQTEEDVDAANVAPLSAAIDAIMKAYDVRTDGIRYSSASGGSIFLSGEWIPIQGARYPGVYSILCGGSDPRHFEWDVTDPALRAKNKLSFTYGDQDSLYGLIRLSIDTFSGKMFSVGEKIIPGAGHCEFDTHAEAIALWNANP